MKIFFVFGIELIMGTNFHLKATTFSQQFNIKPTQAFN